MIEDAGIARDGARWLRQAEAETVAAIEARGEVTGADLSKVVPRLRKQIPYGEGKTWAGKMGMTTRVLFLLACEQRVVRGRPQGSWTSTRYRWAPMTSWLPERMPAFRSRGSSIVAGRIFRIQESSCRHQEQTLCSRAKSQEPDC